MREIGMPEKRIKIKSIQVKNFRSIRNELLNVTDFNIFVGLNDVGKSNFLKAMNLFFNGQTDYNAPFDFARDFTFLFPSTSHSTKEIKITITFTIPDSYKDFGEYVWEQVWRTGVYHKESILISNGESPASRSRVPSAIRQIKYRYVPAVKSADYYKALLGDLYFTVSSSLNNPLQKSTAAFSGVLKEYTKDIGENVFKRLGMESVLTIPNNLNDIFRALVFMTKSDDNNLSVPLNVRGDGIQARHIPIILKFVADEDQKSRNQGSMKVATIWGFEEPENGVELSKAFEMSDEFVDYSSDIQIFVSTHSPAFYMKKTNMNTEVFYASKKPDTDGTSFSTGKSGVAIGENMGLMPLIAPLIAEQEARFKKAQEIYYEHAQADIPTIMVEGKTDKEYMQMAITRLSPPLKQLIADNKLRIITKDTGCGTTQLSDWALAWIYSGNRSRLFILLDKDEAGIKAKQETENCEAYKSKKSTTILNLQYIEPSDEILELHNKHIHIFYEIEHLLSIDFWERLIEKKFLEDRSCEELQKSFAQYLGRNKTLDDTVAEQVDSSKVRDTIVLCNPNRNKKDKILTLARKIFETNPNTEIFNGFARTIGKLEKAFIERDFN